MTEEKQYLQMSGNSIIMAGLGATIEILHPAKVTEI